MESEETIIRGCIEGDKQSFKALYNAYSSKMMAVSLRYFPDRMQAEDVLHNAWLKIFDKINTFKSEGSLEGWMKRVVANEAINELRRISRQGLRLSFDEFRKEESGLQMDFSYNEQEDEVNQRFSAEQLLSALHALPDGYRTVFNLYVFEKMKHHEIASLLGISDNTSKSQLHKARMMLQKKLNTIASEKKARTEKKMKEVSFHKPTDIHKNIFPLKEHIRIVATNAKNSV
jgi:RNA polymerase sigma-70 factor (ECF subfamily)